MNSAEGTSSATPFAAPIPGRARQRAQALTLFSREPHQALKRAIELKWAHQATAQSTWRRLLEFWEHEGSSHLVEEEIELLPAYARGARPSQPPVVRTLLEHVLIRAEDRRDP